MIIIKRLIQALTIGSCLVLFSCFHSDPPDNTPSSDWGTMVWGTADWSDQ